MTVRTMHRSRGTAAAAAMVLMVLAAGCGDTIYDPERATRVYPADLHTTETLNIQVFRDDTTIELVNATTRSFENFDLWLNQRYVRRVQSLPAGGRVRLAISEFYDARGETPVAGGFFRTRAPTPMRLVEIQTDPEAPTLGLIAIPAEDVVSDR